VFAQSPLVKRFRGREREVGGGGFLEGLRVGGSLSTGEEDALPPKTKKKKKSDPVNAPLASDPCQRLPPRDMERKEEEKGRSARKGGRQLSIEGGLARPRIRGRGGFHRLGGGEQRKVKH